jgi:hypothetical protein
MRGTTYTSDGRISTMMHPYASNYRELLAYWIEERYRIFAKKQAGQLKPWSYDTNFRTTYFCNVHREDDKVTRFMRDFYSPYVGHPMFEYNVVFSRFINWPPSIKTFYTKHDPVELKKELNFYANQGKLWGGAYIITTHGQPMGKIDYLVDQVLTDFNNYRENIDFSDTLERAHDGLMVINGIGSFLSAQILADLKNTVGHPLRQAPDWRTFVAPGPGSIRGANRFHYGGVTAANFMKYFSEIRTAIDENWPGGVPPVCNQDLQNCLCEDDKYCRVFTKTGRSKRGYNG